MFWPLDQFSCGESSGCSSDAVCLTIDKENTACVCKDGYHGDGKTCDGEIFVLLCKNVLKCYAVDSTKTQLVRYVYLNVRK